MTNVPDRPGQVLLDDAICKAIESCIASEWPITYYDVVGVLTIIAARYAHTMCEHEEG